MIFNCYFTNFTGDLKGDHGENESKKDDNYSNNRFIKSIMILTMLIFGTVTGQGPADIESIMGFPFKAPCQGHISHDP